MIFNEDKNYQKPMNDMQSAGIMEILSIFLIKKAKA